MMKMFVLRTALEQLPDTDLNLMFFRIKSII